MSLIDRLNQLAERHPIGDLTPPAPAPAPRPQARWLRVRDERLAERERDGGSRHDAVADTTGTVLL